MPRIAVVDDQPDMRQQLCSMIDQYSRENNCMLEVTAFSDGAQIITNYCKGFDIIFLDIEMPELGGMDAAERIRTVDPDVVLVFVTNMAQYAIRGYEVDALDFVLKPVNYYQFSTKLARALQRVQRRKGGQIALQTAGGRAAAEHRGHLLAGNAGPYAALPYLHRGMVRAFQPAKC